MLVGGCGGSGGDAPSASGGERAAYETTLRQITMERTAAVGPVQPPPSGAPLPEHAPQVRALAQLMRGVADDMSRVAAPAEIRDSHGKYVHGSQQMARFLLRAADAMARGDQGATNRLLSQMNSGRAPGIKLIREARAEYQSLGYRLPTGGSVPSGEGTDP